MLFLITGQPGNGKTLHTLGLVEKLRSDPASVAIGREVYYWGIPDLALNWKKLGTEDEWLEARQPKWAGDCPWYDLPNGSIVVIDECQHVFRPRKQGAETPRRVSEFETHRHRGFDVFLITQHPQLLDINVRKLVGRHIHVRRTFGQETATLFQWEVATDPNDRGAQNRALQTRWSFPKEQYEWYKSAEIHTVKKELPWKKLVVLGGSLLGAVALGAVAVSRLSAIGDVEQDVPVTGAVTGPALDLDRSVTWTPASFTPRAEPWAWSSPFYDKVAEIASAPRIAGCSRLTIDDVQTCTCNNDQGGRIDVTQGVCEDFMAGKIYDPLKPYVDVKAANIAYLNASGGSLDGAATDAPEGQSVPNRSTSGS